MQELVRRIILARFALPLLRVLETNQHRSGDVRLGELIQDDIRIGILIHAITGQTRERASFQMRSQHGFQMMS